MEGSGCGSVGRAVAEVRRSNPVIGQKIIYIEFVILSTMYQKDKIKKKRLGMAHFFKKTIKMKWGGHYSSVVSSATTIPRPQV